ncbi:DUF3278 domain-containing protein (plasmid) [Nicoliella spurrieriana]|uniref:DUF3278 domain-containing protein n=1 Tax=Nicoliella spurrieriana TaxID=2925830 RepID=A0A976RQF0_9LACO|nr:DUF3278 domain-containing protein [Nicoliella spurrieriana]UQS85940.1 DUF3278 domain-containing protein [Nicoliella spurrieriana]
MKNERESLYVRYLKYFYGINGPLDEYRENEINKIGNHLFLVLFNYNVVSTLLIIIFAFNGNSFNALMWLIIANAVVIMIIVFYASFKVQSLRLDRIDVDSNNDYAITLKHLRRKTLRLALLFFVVERGFSTIFETVTSDYHGALWQNVTSIYDNSVALVITIGFAVGTYRGLKRKIDREK